MISKEVKRLIEIQEEVSDVCDEIHNILKSDFNLLCNILIKYEPSFDEAKLNISLVYFNRYIAEYIYDLNNNRIFARKANFNSIDTNGNKYNPLAICEAFELDIKNKLNANIFVTARNHDK